MTDKTATCWFWTGPVDRHGYGRISEGGGGGRLRFAHRVSYEIHVGTIPTGLVIDHLCRNRRCVNPAHLEPVTVGENVLRGETLTARNKALTTCHRGHPFDAANTTVCRGRRFCRACAREKYRQRRGEA